MINKMSEKKSDKQNQPELEKKEPINREPKNTEKEFGGPKGLEPTRFGDWEKNGRCSDF